MKILLPAIVGVFALLASGCAPNTAGTNGESRLSGRAGVQVGSRDTAGIAPTRPGLQPPAN